MRGVFHRRRSNVCSSYNKKRILNLHMLLETIVYRKPDGGQAV